MYNRDELMSKDVIELFEIIKSLNSDPSQFSEPSEAVEFILQHQEESSTEEAPKRKRSRVVKKDTTDKVYRVAGNDGENLDKPAPKKRGRKSKAELEAIARMEAAKKEEESLKFLEDVVQEQPATPKADADDNKSVSEAEELTQEQQASAEPVIVETETDSMPVSEESKQVPELDTDVSEKPSQMQENANTQNVIEENIAAADVVWEGDPGDGTDFIIVTDIPIEDSNIVNAYELYGNRVVDDMQSSSAVSSEDGMSAEDMEQIRQVFKDAIRFTGVLEVSSDSQGFLRSSDYNYLSSPDDVYVSAMQVRKYGLKMGDVIECNVLPPFGTGKYFTLENVISVNGRNPEEIHDRIQFEHLTPLFPQEKFTLCGDPATTNLSTRIVDLFAPIGKGQRALIVAQPKTGKTMLMKNIANAIASSHPEAYLMMLLIDERPEEVTDMARTVKAEVIASTFDEPAERHVKIAGLVLEKAKRMVECGHDVVIFLDSITRLARAYNTVSPASGKVLTGGVDANALQKPKRFFGAARNIEGGGSLTIIATALTDTGSKMDEVIFEEFKGTGNMELQLERSLANKRIFPAINLVASSTRRDDLLQDKTTLDRMWVLRNYIADMNPIEAMNDISSRLSGTKDNDEFIITMNSN